LKAAAIGATDEVILTTKKPLRAFQKVPYIEKERIDLNAMRKARIIMRDQLRRHVSSSQRT
jgi:hypothetical protein